MIPEPTALQLPEALFARTLEFCRVLKASRLPVTHGRVIDAFRSLEEVGFEAREDFRVALRANLTSSDREVATFDRAFDAFFSGEDEAQGHRMKLRQEFLRGDLDQGWDAAHDELRGEPLEWNGEERERDQRLEDRWDDESPPIEDAIRELAKRLATRPSRRYRGSTRGPRVDIRRSLRCGARYGMEVLELRRAARRVRKTRIVMLCDVSGSMDAFNPFLLRLMLGLQKALKNSRTVVFSTETTDISGLLRRRSVAQALREVGSAVRHWSGGTDIGRALGALNRRVLRGGSQRSTVAVVISDGYDQGDSETIAREMRALKRRVRSVVWVNPMYGSLSYQPTAQGMRAALPYVDHFLPAWDNDSLRILVRELGSV